MYRKERQCYIETQRKYFSSLSLLVSAHLHVNTFCTFRYRPSEQVSHLVPRWVSKCTKLKPKTQTFLLHSSDISIKHWTWLSLTEIHYLIKYFLVLSISKQHVVSVPRTPLKVNLLVIIYKGAGKIAASIENENLLCEANFPCNHPP